MFLVGFRRLRVALRGVLLLLTYSWPRYRLTMVGVKSQNTQEGGPSEKVTADRVRKRKRGKDTGFVALTPDVVQKDIQGAGVNTTTFPLDQILGFKISLQVLGFQISEDGPTGALVVIPSGPKKNLLKVVKAGDRILIIGEKNLATQPVPLDEIADYVKDCQRPFNIYLHRPAKESSGPVTISLLDDSEDDIEIVDDISEVNRSATSLTISARLQTGCRSSCSRTPTGPEF